MPSIEMERGLLQVLFRYLPEAWIDFHSGKAVAKVAKWDSRPLEGINKIRLLKRVERALSSFKELRGISDRLKTDDYEILKPKYIQVKAEPLSFFCRKCRKAYHFKTVENMRRTLQGQYKCRCGGRLQQMDIIYACQCGWTGPVTPMPCKKNKAHGFDNITYLDGNYSTRAWICSLDGNRVQINKLCPECKKLLYPTPFRQSDVFIPRTLTMIDLIDSAEERTLEDRRTPKLVNASWLDLLGSKELRKLIEQGIENPKEDEDYEKELAEKINMLLEAGIPEDMAENAAKNMIKRENPDLKITNILNDYDNILHNSDEADYASAVNILEYRTVLSSKEVSDLDDAQKKAKMLSSSAVPESFKTSAERFGFKDVHACCGVPIVFCSYGYSRRNSVPSSAVLRGLPADRELERTGKKPIYAACLETEGIIFEVSRRKIVEWLLKNEIIDPKADNLPDNIEDDQLLKAWFLRNVKPTSVNRYNEIDSFEKITKDVYTLLHSMAHVLIKTAAGLCGLEKDSLSEYILPSIPAFLIYCHNAQGFSLGALFNLFEAFFDKWLQNSLDMAENCIYDPICLDDKGACLGCLHLNEISCEHFNKDLNRSFLVGRVEPESRFWGFWEDI